MHKHPAAHDLSTKGFVSLKQFASLLGVSYNTARNMKDRKEVEVLEVGGISRVYAAEVRKHLRKEDREYLIGMSEFRVLDSVSTSRGE